MVGDSWQVIHERHEIIFEGYFDRLRGESLCTPFIYRHEMVLVIRAM